MKRRVNELMMEIQQCYAENIKIWEIEVIVAEMDKIFSFTQDLQRIIRMRSSKIEIADQKAAGEEGKELYNLRIPKWQLTPFDASVHSRTDLNGIRSDQKFICLRSNLKGPALDVISGFSITATNYPEAVKTLRE
ncbi:hypothetical protein T4A_57 [Trichinella pseudospiralis]|uniref:Uncharacterized protein n=1 Tax=Trichinella pseudospiralis TaxID=6337 RepID=A0A0V1K8I2_TRIPS|nr:hypothetical protein T4A_57 [Trichinella pseudospiralis]KRZ43253.1 hypothetical protein T4C_13843 [Trichinella pseudospiralis]